MLLLLLLKKTTEMAVANLLSCCWACGVQLFNAVDPVLLCS
jgi:hypothetical protein